MDETRMTEWWRPVEVMMQFRMLSLSKLEASASSHYLIRQTLRRAVYILRDSLSFHSLVTHISRNTFAIYTAFFYTSRVKNFA